MSDPLAQSRDTYRHGDLRSALVSAGIEMARAGGPDAIVLREATRSAGVSPNAAYRHFADRQALLIVVSATAQGLVANAMFAARAAVVDSGDAVADARARLRAVGTGYLSFARTEPGLFRAAFTVPDDLSRSGDPSKAGDAGFTPFQVLSVTLDELVEVGVLPAERRPGAELLAWASVHGLGMLVIDGPLRGLTDPMIDGSIARLLEMVDRGL
ncbi:TetR/AcrR family transcriptional regulator [Glaciihabitans arcticus]|uniref:TetR/AcrR family transcriptional regulator n=1 Tax=Glaciihabitans arcticus TaxID=2668039 RepID=A0A4Q9GWU4_9MICO|nr:TetR/AcrR family transcriptional regulator [Glaciihabitans arcticus]TBN57173.1 TetR/AcrR family transcriptional regulator [Glaciihabitans arcticus]